ncbi:MAG: acyltransferase domain-containing protein [Chloroflexota bacterium]|nr:acyltransferase domain-containing protein [Chloroflexota bacterium]
MPGIIETLRADDVTASWIGYLDELGPPSLDVDLPEPNALPAVLRALDVPDEDVADLIMMLPSAERDPDTWWLLTRATHSLVRHMGTVEGPPEFPKFPNAVAGTHRFFFVYVYLATLVHVQAYHRARGIPAAIGRELLADLGRSMREYRLAHGTGGFIDAAWLMIHFRGLLYHLGRLQFERRRLGRRIGAAVNAAGLDAGTDDPALGIHIPALSGALAPEACDASIVEAAAFFARYFPGERYEIAVCDSWLLDPQLAEYLPATSNIVRFQCRFRLAAGPDPVDEWILRFVFGRADVDLDTVPQRTTLERAVASHLRAGRTWHGGLGWLVLPGSTPRASTDTVTS